MEPLYMTTKASIHGWFVNLCLSYSVSPRGDERKLFNTHINSVQPGPQLFKFYTIRKRNFKKASSIQKVTSL